MTVSPVLCPLSATVACPTVTPGTSEILLRGPVGSSPTAMPQSRIRFLFILMCSFLRKTAVRSVRLPVSVCIPVPAALERLRGQRSGDGMLFPAPAVRNRSGIRDRQVFRAGVKQGRGYPKGNPRPNRFVSCCMLPGRGSLLPQREPPRRGGIRDDPAEPCMQTSEPCSVQGGDLSAALLLPASAPPRDKSTGWRAGGLQTAARVGLL